VLLQTRHKVNYVAVVVIKPITRAIKADDDCSLVTVGLPVNMLANAPLFESPSSENFVDLCDVLGIFESTYGRWECHIIHFTREPAGSGCARNVFRRMNWI
jgi:hypothetical protein